MPSLRFPRSSNDFQYFGFYGVTGVAAVLGVAEASVSAYDLLNQVFP